MNFIPSLKKIMANLVERVQRVVSLLKGESHYLRSENVALKEQLAQALSNDVSDAETIAAARKDAEDARAALESATEENVRLQELVDADAAEDAALDAVLASVESQYQQEEEPAPTE